MYSYSFGSTKTVNYYEMRHNKRKKYSRSLKETIEDTVDWIEMREMI